MGYRLIYDSYGPIGFYSEKKEYEPGEKVKVTYVGMATDASYTFKLDAPDYQVKWEECSAEITFVMPEHDVTLSCEMRNVMNPAGGMAIPKAFLGMAMADPNFSGRGFEPGSVSYDVFYPKDRYAFESGSKAGEDTRPEWTCENCGAKNKGRFCSVCGSPKGE